MRRNVWVDGAMAIVLLAALSFGGGVPNSSAATAPPALKTALTHAGFAAKYDTVKEVTLHLHHVVNCIVGPGDKMYDASAGNPCNGQGTVLADIQKGVGKDKEYYEAWYVAYVADNALMSRNLAQEQGAAHLAVDVLTDIVKGM